MLKRHALDDIVSGMRNLIKSAIVGFLLACVWMLTKNFFLDIYCIVCNIPR